MKLQMHDQTNRMNNFDARKETADILIRLLIAFFIFAAIATGFTIASIKDAQANARPVESACIASDNLISEDMQAFISLYGNGELFDEGDLQ